MAKCPKCGRTVALPTKTWSTSSRKKPKRGEPKLLMGMFECMDCQTRFRAAVTAGTMTEDTVSIKNMVEKIKSIKGELMQTLKSLREKIKTLETERSNLMVEIEELKKVAESKVSALEGEVKMLRDEVESLRELLGYTQEPEK